MKKIIKKKYIVILVLCLLLIAISLFIGYGVPRIGKQSYTEDKTYEYTATFKSKEKHNESYIVYLNNNFSLIFNSASIINETRFNNLEYGEKITFRSVYNFDKSNHKEYPVDIVSLKTEDAEIVTLESSKNTVTQGEIEIAVTATVFSIFFLIGGIVCVLYLFGVLPKKKKLNN